MKQEFYDAILDNPIIAAAKNDDDIDKIGKIKDVRIVFLLFGDVATIGKSVDKVKGYGKIAIVHMDLILGLSSKIEAVDFVKAYTQADGIISTHSEQIRYASEIGLFTVYRIFMLDSKAFEKANKAVVSYTDAIEILPGLMPKIIRKTVEKFRVPIIAGGMISEKEDVLNALDAGAIAISSTNENVWCL
ncbi:MAG: glycerol-3-phosphate responsive antiterminator [Bacteroidaceae bacterium]|nr:glycerol-3-phosphate responsive antiterminator [Bacteroidaceae bacterium]